MGKVVKKGRAGGTWSDELYQHLHEIFRVSEEGFVVRVKSTRGKSTPLGRAGSLMSNGYRQINWSGFSNHGLCNVQYEHRVIYFMVYKEIPEQVDHIDGNRSNNHICNLRKSNNRDNQMNRHTKAGKDRDLPIGVYCIKRKGREGLWYNAIFSYNGIRKNSTFRSLEKAINRRKEWEILYAPH